MRSVERGWRPHRIAVLAAAAMLAVAAVLGLTARTAVHHQTKRLLGERANELNLVFTASVSKVSS